MLEVIGAGFGRTGTLSLKAALERLGFGPCHHMLGLFDRPEEISLWQDAALGKPVDWDAMYEGYRSSVDWPGARFWRELADHYPEAKFILTVRDPERWYDSAHSTIHRAAIDDSPASPVLTEMRAMSRDVVWDGVFDGRFPDRAHALRVFDEHIAAVRDHFSEDRLLVFEVTEGWEPLCSFLGVPVPAEPFPRSNDQGDFDARLREHATGEAPSPAA
ncbi:sulfotransferase family protein [Actinomadura barringtoniae]|uniref:Sulfotransferase family protein n=1 Tax=Actinomadura barringtoniae TaxID=1427535 RepID=A0A939PET2_9ACTN|nr:sulfotransferase family protein [Actinomadura barringtoniae]MBO2447196.1 sulfotransferase family protein [Actinomadura barringtoniae]